MSSTPDRTQPQSMRGLLIWSALLLLSAGLLLYLALSGAGASGPVTDAAPAADTSFRPESGTDPRPEESSDNSGLWALWISGLTLATSTAGLIFNAWLGWRKELRETRLDRLEAQQLRAELEKTLLEVQQLREELKAEG